MGGGGEVTQGSHAALHGLEPPRGRGRVRPRAGRQAAREQRLSSDAAGQAQGTHVNYPSLSAASSHPSCPKMLPQSISACSLCFPPHLRSPQHSPGVPTRFSPVCTGSHWRGVPRFDLQPCSPNSKNTLRSSHFGKQLSDRLCMSAF